MKYRVLEPHADDAFLSLGAHIKRWVDGGDEVEIVTVYSTEKRSAEALEYASSVGASHTWLGHIESGGMDRKPDTIVYLPPMENCITLCPLGLRHVEHYAVRDAVEAGKGPTDTVWYYVDQPYAMQLKNQTQMNNLLAGLQIVSTHKPGARKYIEKTIKIFKSQNMFFYFNKDILPATIEMVVKQYDK